MLAFKLGQLLFYSLVIMVHYLNLFMQKRNLLLFNAPINLFYGKRFLIF